MSEVIQRLFDGAGYLPLLWVRSVSYKTSIMKKISCVILYLSFQVNVLYSQETITINVDPSTTVGTLPPLWRDHYEVHLTLGYGGNPTWLGPHTSLLSDPDLGAEMARLEPRFIRVSNGRADNPPDTSYYSSSTSVLKELPYEFYKGGNNLTDADDLSNYDFSYIDSLITVVQSFGAEPFITMDYMPFVLSSDTTPNYNGLIGFVYQLAYDNTIRNAPPENNAVYGRVMYQFIKHCYDSYGVTYFEHWNEPDQNFIMEHFFWSGTKEQLYAAYEAIANEVSADASLANAIKLGGCSFALYSGDQMVPLYFLQQVQTNSDKLDFLSFHPYSDTQLKGGYDSTKVALVKNWRDTYVPNAELINAEWGRIDQNTDTWGGLNYGLHKMEHTIDMLNRDVAMSFEVCLFDPETSTDNYTYLGMYRVGPIVPKPAAYVYYNMNRMNDAVNRLPLTIDPGMYALAGMTTTSDKIVVVFPAPTPTSGNNTVHLNLAGLPWGAGPFHVDRYELTDQSYQLGVINNLTHSSAQNGATFSDTVVYAADNNSGRFIIWEIYSDGLSGIGSGPEPTKFLIHPNPATDNFEIQFNELPTTAYTITISDMLGNQVYLEAVNNLEKDHTIHAKLNNGFYFVRIPVDGKVYSSKISVR